MLDWYKQGAGGPTSNARMFELYRRRAEELRRGEAQRQRRVRLRVPQGIDHRNMLLLNVAADGTVEMSEADAESFLRAGWVRVDADDLTGWRAVSAGDHQLSDRGRFRWHGDVHSTDGRRCRQDQGSI